MKKSLNIGLCALGLTLGATGCKDFLTGPKLTDDPNHPTQATNVSLFVTNQAALFLQQEGLLARTVCAWMQQCAATGANALVGTYGISEDDYFDPWALTYGGGGLIDLKLVEERTAASGDLAFAGIAKVVEVLLIGTTADIWGGIPYSEAAAGISAPKADSQNVVYNTLQAKLDTAISFLGQGGAGPGAADLVYGGDKTKWVELANTLKARYWLHAEEKLGTFAYDSALKYATLGISSPANDYRAYHSSAAGERNLWASFGAVYPTYQAAGSFLVNLLLNSRPGDPRLGQYFTPNASNAFVGVDPGDNGQSGSFSGLNVSDDYQQPLVTWAENQLILAEANFVLSGAGAAQPLVNAVRTQADTSAGNTVLPPLTVGQVTLDAIMEEKYIVLFQNLEAWNDYKRTCKPALVSATAPAPIPGRLAYPTSERNANPSIPDAGPQLNWNDPVSCP